MYLFKEHKGNHFLYKKNHLLIITRIFCNAINDYWNV